MTKKELEIENKELTEINSALRDEVRRLKAIEPAPKHVACGYQIEIGERVYGTKESINILKAKMQELYDFRDDN